MTTAQELAREMADAFETATREKVTETRLPRSIPSLLSRVLEEYLRLRDGSPEWMSTVCRYGHDDGPGSGGLMLPDDWRYACIASACEHIAETDPTTDPSDAAHDFADAYVDDYTQDLTAWLASHLVRVTYCERAAEEFGDADSCTFEQRIRLGQNLEARTVYEAVRDTLEDVAARHDPSCTRCEHDCPHRGNPLGAPYCQTCDDHHEAGAS